MDKDMLMNIATLLINHLMGRTSNADAPPGLFPNFTLASVRRLLMICAGIGAGLVLFFGGFFTVLLDLILTSREHEQLMLSPASIVGFALIGISCLFTAGLFSRKMWRMAPQFRQQATAPSPVQEAMADLIRDFIEERRMGREFAAEQFAAQAAAAAAMEPASAPTAEPASSTTNSIPPYPVHSAYN